MTSVRQSLCTCILRATAVRPCDDFEQMTVGIFEVHPTPAVVVVDRAGALLTGIGPVLELSFAQTCEDPVEILFPEQEGIVLSGDLAVGVVEVERDAVGELDHEERSEPDWLRQAQ